MVIYGAHLGSTLFRMLLGKGLKGSSRQVGAFQDLFKIVGTALFVSLLYIEVYTGTPLVLALVRAVAANTETAAAILNFGYNVTLAIGFTLLAKPTQRFIERHWPVSATENFAMVQYLDQRALDFPETALDLAEKEQLRLVERLPDFLAALTEGRLTKEDARLQLRATDDLHRTFTILATEIDAYLTSLVDRQHSHETSERLINSQSRQSAIESLEEATYNLVSAVRETPPTPQLAALVERLAEALDFLLHTAADVATSQQAEDAQLLVQMCADRGELMGKIRSMHMDAEHNLGQEDKVLLLTLTTLFERIVWIVRRFGKLLHQAAVRPS